MRRYTIYNRLTAVAAGLCLCWLFMACGEDRGGDLPDDDPNHCVVTITLRTSRSVRPPQTKAGGMMTKADETTETDFWAKDEEYERDITNWLVVAYDENADLAGYISGKDGTWTPDISNEDSRTTVEMKLPFGTYHFYAFAAVQAVLAGHSLCSDFIGRLLLCRHGRFVSVRYPCWSKRRCRKSSSIPAVLHHSEDSGTGQKTHHSSPTETVKFLPISTTSR